RTRKTPRTPPNADVVARRARWAESPVVAVPSGVDGGRCSIVGPHRPEGETWPCASTRRLAGKCPRDFVPPPAGHPIRRGLPPHLVGSTGSTSPPRSLLHRRCPRHRLPRSPRRRLPCRRLPRRHFPRRRHSRRRTP